MDILFRDICIEQNGFKVLNYLAYWSLRLFGCLAWKRHRKMIKFWRWVKSLFIKEYQVLWVDPRKEEYFFRSINKVSPTI